MLCVLLLPVCAFGQTVRHHREAVVTDAVTPEVVQAEAAIEKRDFATAEKLLATGGSGESQRRPRMV